MKVCIQCGKTLRRYALRYCSNQCQGDFQYITYIKKWNDGKVTGSRGVNAKNTSRHLNRFLREKYNNKCSICFWKQINTASGKVPLEIDHIDGNSENNSESNLRLLCPNCHALTSNYKNLNLGRGRQWRRAKYIKV